MHHSLNLDEKQARLGISSNHPSAAHPTVPNLCRWLIHEQAMKAGETAVLTGLLMELRQYHLAR
jgi:hypothetical protein